LRDRGKLQTPYAKRIMKKRGSTVEPVLGTMLNFLNLKRVNTRGIKAANKHVMMSALAYNLKKLLKFDRPKLKTIAKALQKEIIKTGELLHFSKGLYQKQIRQF
jgi:hypothetical protein